MRYIVNPVKGANLNRYPKGNVYQGHGENIELYLKSIGVKGHNGVDIAAKEGTPILATAGVVCEVKNTPEGYGKHVRILTDSDVNGDYFELTYGHLKDIIVPIGLKVTDGFQIGTMGNTGFIVSGNTPYWGSAPVGRGVHLHFGVRECSTKDTGWVTTYSTGLKSFIKNYSNGVKGSVDPMPFLQEWLDRQKIAILQQMVELYKKIIKILTTNPQ